MSYSLSTNKSRYMFGFELTKLTLDEWKNKKYIWLFLKPIFQYLNPIIDIVHK